MRPVLRLALTSLLLSAGCRHFDVCTDERPCAAHDIADAADPARCSDRLYSCDETLKNGCETDISSDPEHCGGCDQVCSGLCAEFRCTPFEVVDAKRSPPTTPLLVSGDYVYSFTTSYYGDELYDLRSMRSANGEVNTIASRAWKSVTASTVNASRIYASDELHLVSLPRAGGELKVEHEAVDAVAGLGSDVAVLRGGQVSFRRGDVGEFEPISGLEDVEELRAGQRVLFGARGSEFFTYDPESEQLDWFPRVTSFLIDLGQIDDADEGPAMLYFVAEDDAGTATLFRTSVVSDTRALLDMSDVTSWALANIFSRPCLVALCVVASYERERDEGLWVANPEAPDSLLRWSSRGPLNSVTLLTEVGSELSPQAWLYDGYQRALVRVRLLDALTPRFE
jgi:hypothetical protein